MAMRDGASRRRRSGKRTDEEGHQLHDMNTNDQYMAAITESLTSIAQHPADVLTKRRRMQHFFGSGSSVGMCLPKECGKQDVKIITGYYWFWLKCGHIIAPESGGGGGRGFRRALQHGGGPSMEMLKELTQCGQTKGQMRWR